MSKDRYDIYDDYEANRKRRKSNSAPSGKRGKKKKKRSLKAKFFMVLFVVLLVYCVSALGYFGYQYYIEDGTSVAEGDERENKGLLDMLVKPKLKERTTFVIMGVDKDGDRTDTIMVCCYNQPLDELTIISIPRDTLIEVSDDDFRKLREEYPEPGKKGMKINEITHYGQEKYGRAILFSEIEEIIGVPIDYYCTVKFEALNYIVDAIGGIQYNVPIRMYYQDPGQDLDIDLQPGLQTLNGKQAEELVRFRKGYSNQDIGRVATQQEFCKELIKQLVNKDTFFNNAAAYLKTFFSYVDTVVKLSVAVMYMAVVKDFNTDNINTYTMPGDIGSMYGFVGGWVLNEEEAHELCYNVFQKPVSEIKAERESEAASGSAEGTTTSAYNDKSLSVQVLNGGYTNGKASAVQNELLNAGYDVKSIGTYSGDKTDNTRIFVKKEGMGKKIQEQFPGSEIVVDPTTASEHDIVVVIGIKYE